jgi:uncharacterized membrane protein YccC
MSAISVLGERVLFLGTLALWIGICTCVSRNARDFAYDGFALSGYTGGAVARIY